MTKKQNMAKKPSRLENKTITLIDPIKHDGETIKQLVMRPPRVRDMLSVDKISESEMEKEVTLFANLTEVSPDVMQDLHQADYMAVRDAYQGFLF